MRLAAGIPLFLDTIRLELTGPCEVFIRRMDTKADFPWKAPDRVTAGGGRR